MKCLVLLSAITCLLGLVSMPSSASAAPVKGRSCAEVRPKHAWIYEQQPGAVVWERATDDDFSSLWACGRKYARRVFLGADTNGEDWRTNFTLLRLTRSRVEFQTDHTDDFVHQLKAYRASLRTGKRSKIDPVEGK